MSSLENEILQISLSQLRSQKEDLRNFRNQAGFMSATSGIVATVFAGLLPDVTLDEFLSGNFFMGYRVEAFLVLFLFSLSMLFSFRVVICWGKVTFDLDIADLAKRMKKASSRDDFTLVIASEIDRYCMSNEDAVSRARNDLFFAGIFSFCQIPAWLCLLV
jgi:hypothetical protein